MLENKMLKRKFYKTLLEWKASHRKECLLVKGARQIGKTFIIQEFGKRNYSSYLYINFIENPEYREIFDGNLDANEIFRRISITFQAFRLIPGDTLIFLDEIQKCPMARTAFKPLSIDGRADVIGSGSLLGLTFLADDKEIQHERDNSSIPVGYERHATMHPLDFEEFLWALGYREDTIDILRDAFNSLSPLPASINDKMLMLFREYIAIGGMPEVINRFVGENSFSAAHAEQTKIIESNLDDMARYAPNTDKPKIRACYLSLPNQLARVNTKFKYSLVQKGSDARKFSSSVDWIREAALVLQCHNLETPELPLVAFRKSDSFKLFASDIGLLVGMMGFPAMKPIVDGTLKGYAKGGIYENVMMNLLVCRGYSPYYYMPKSNMSEVDFLIEKDGMVVPIEVKSENAASASFNRMLERPEIKIGYKFVNGNIGKVGKKITLPHYMVMFL